jgi:uncharacterized protein YkwD
MHMNVARSVQTKNAIVCLLIGINILSGFSMLIKLNSPTANATKVLGVRATVNSDTPSSMFAAKITDLINSKRQAHDKNLLAYNQNLEKVAQLRANSMLHSNYYAHKDPSGKYYYDYFDSTVIKNGFSCENLNMEFTTTPEVHSNDWMHSASHRECLLNSSVTAVGIAMVQLPAEHPISPGVPTYIVVAILATNE